LLPLHSRRLEYPSNALLIFRMQLRKRTEFSI
jgi:hypothetical protein